MSYSIIQYPAHKTSSAYNLISPVYNPIVFTVDSPNKAQCSHQYICDVYVNGSYVKRLKNFPQGVNGYGTFAVETILSDYLTFDLQHNLYGSTLFAKNPNSILSYELKFGEEYDSSAQCDAGTTLYVNIVSSNSIASFKAFNGALEKKEWLDWDYANYLPAASGVGKWLTNTPNDSLITVGSQMVWNIFCGSATIYLMSVRTYTSDGSLINEYDYLNPLSISSFDMVSVGVGPENLNNTTLYYGTQPVINSAVSYYTIQLYNASITAIGELKTIKLDRRYTKFNHHRLWFLNHFGGFDSYTYTLKDQITTDISRTEFTKIYGELRTLSPGSTWTYDLQDRGRTTLLVNGQDSAIYQSNWLTELESLWMKELLMTLEVYEISNNDPVCFGSLNIGGGGISIGVGLGEGGIGVGVGFAVGGLVQVDVGDNEEFDELNDQFTITGTGNGTITINGPYDGENPPPATGDVSLTGSVQPLGFVAELDPLIMKSKAYEQKTKNKIKNINYLIEVDKAYGLNRQRN